MTPKCALLHKAIFSDGEELGSASVDSNPTQSLQGGRQGGPSLSFLLCKWVQHESWAAWHKGRVHVMCAQRPTHSRYSGKAVGSAGWLQEVLRWMGEVQGPGVIPF
jgi:hypothetical protein